LSKILNRKDGDEMEELVGFTGFVVIIILFLVVLAILWFLLPFAVFGIKDKLNKQIMILESIRMELKKIRIEKEEGQM
jgi:hypothetical protein